MSDPIQKEDFDKLKQSLPTVFRPDFKNDKSLIYQAFPLLNMICKDRKLINRLKAELEIPEAPSGAELEGQLATICQALSKHFNNKPLLRYRLPIILSEFPVHSRPINKAIQVFNNLVETIHQQKTESDFKEDVVGLSERTDLSDCFDNILQAIASHGSHCDQESGWQLLEMMSGWSNISLYQFFKEADMDKEDKEDKEEQRDSLLEQKRKKTESVNITELKQPSILASRNPFIEHYNYNFNGAGQLDSETNYLLLNAFGIKIGGHSDAQVKYPPRYIPLDELHAIIRRQLSHRMEINQNEAFRLWLEQTLHRLGVQFIHKNNGCNGADILVNPFLSKPISFLSPETIVAVLKQTLDNSFADELNLSQSKMTIIAQYLYELLQGFQVNPGQALGIGANWDGTVNLSNEAGTYAFKFIETEAQWGRRFKQISLHRQGPSEAKMNAAIGIKFELQTLLSNQKYMTQLQPSEYKEVIYNALIDNLVTDLFPQPAYFENDTYRKYRRQYVVRKTDANITKIDSYYVPSPQGTFFKHRTGEPKQTPMYRRAGTLDVLPFPKNSGCCQQSRVWYEGNPLGPMQLQHAQSMHRSSRGHLVYNPIGPDQFLEDVFYGQVIRADNGDYLPFIGVIPKNFDKHFKQKNELCASFVLRMMQSSRIIEHCPTFTHAYNQIKSRFLPAKETNPPELPKFCNDYIIQKRQKLISQLSSDDRKFKHCEHKFYSLFKNLIYSLYQYGQEDDHFKHSFLAYINSRETFYPISRAKCEKLIQDLSVNRPANISTDSVARYDDILNYLRQLSAYFYPKPSDTLAKEIAREAKQHVKPLLCSKGVKHYFKQQRKNKQRNLSRKQSPGMILATLKKGSIHQIYKRMHRKNFTSFYRDADGTPNATPQPHDRFLDWGAKKLGASLRYMNEYHTLAVIHYPFSELVLRAKQRSAQHRKSKALWAIGGGLEGFFWHGLAKGLWYTTISPFKMAKDFLAWNYHLVKKKKITLSNNPFDLPAAPANEAGLKTLAAAESRDLLLKLLASKDRPAVKKRIIINFILEQITILYPNLTENEHRLYRQHLEHSFPLKNNEWQTLFNPLLITDSHAALSALLHHYNPYVNKSLLQAVFRCVTDPLFSSQSQRVVKDNQSFYGLSGKQNDLLKKILILYRQSSTSDQQKLIQYFQFGGVIHRALLVRDQLIQKTQNFMLKMFDQQALLDYLFTQQIDKLTVELNPQNLHANIAKLPYSLKWPLKQLLTKNDRSLLDEYDLSKKQTQFLLKVSAIYNQMAHKKQHAIVRLCQSNPNDDDKFLSVKDKAHRKWAQFAQREFKHQPLSQQQANAVVVILIKKLKNLKKIKPLLNNMKEAYPSLAQHNSLNQFFETIDKIDGKLMQILAKQKKTNANYSEAQTLLINFRNITMNAVINSKLDQIDIFNTIKPQNPLLATTAIKQWLTNLSTNNRDFRSLLKQQVIQSPSLDHAVWRCKCILQIVEGENHGKRVAKTGLQSLLRFWIQHKHNVTMTGETYYGPEGELNKCTYETLTKDSVTVAHAITRVKTKLSPISIFRQTANDPKKELNLEEKKYHSI